MLDKNILCVDDEKNILTSIQRSLRGNKYHLTTRSSAKEALDYLDDSSVQVIITDYLMPEMNGLEFIQHVRKKYPEILTIMLSGHATINQMMRYLNNGDIYRFLIKPWDANELNNVVNDAFEHFEHLLHHPEEKHCKTQIELTEELGQNFCDAYIYQNLPCAIFVCNKTGNLLSYNTKAKDFIPDLKFNEILFPKLTDNIRKHVAKAITSTFHDDSFDCQWKNKKIHVAIKYIMENDFLIILIT